MDLIPLTAEGADAAPEVGATASSADEDPTIVRGATVAATTVPETAPPEQALLAEYVLIQMDDDGSTRLEDVARALSEIALNRPPLAPAGGQATLQMRTFNVKVWMRSDGHQVLEAQDDQQRTCSLIARRG